jgi:hypothetical protein
MTEGPASNVVSLASRASLRAIERAEANEEGEDRSRSEYGTIDAHVARTDTWNGKPAIYVKDRLSGKIIPCVMSDELAAREGPSHSWTDAWAGKRVRVKGRIFYDKRGSINRVSAVDLSDVEPKPVDIKSLREINILSGKSPTEHLATAVRWNVDQLHTYDGSDLLGLTIKRADGADLEICKPNMVDGENLFNANRKQEE